jgi:hypothetical protein
MAATEKVHADHVALPDGVDQQASGNVLDRGPDGESQPAHGQGSGPVVPAGEIWPYIDRVFKYTLRRGLLITVVFHPFFKALMLLYRYEDSGEAQVDIAIMPRSLRWFMPFRVRVSVAEGELNVSLHFLWRWLENLYDRFVVRNGRDLPRSQILKTLLAVYTGQHVAYKDLRSAPKSQVFKLITAVSLVPSLLALVFYPPLRIIWVVIRSLSATLRTAVRPVPALLAILVIMFATGDAWRMFGLEPLLRFILLITVVIGLSMAALFLSMRSPGTSWRTLIGYPGDDSGIFRAWAERTPAKNLIDAGVVPVPPLNDSDVREPNKTAEIPGLERNVAMVYRLTMVVHVIAVAFWLSMTFMAIGMVVVSRTMTNKLSDVSAIVIFHQNLFGQDFILTRQLVLLSTTLGCVAALTFATSTLQSAEGRKAFADYALLDLRKSLGALSYYFGAFAALLLELRNRGILDELRKVDKESMTTLLSSIERSPPSDT